MNPILCSDSQPIFLNFFDLSIAPSLLFYTYIPAILISLLLGSYILIKQKFSLESKLLFSIIGFYILWVVAALIQWLSAYNDAVFFSWQIILSLEISIFILSIYFTYVITNKNKSDISNSLKALFLFIMLIVFVTLPTDYNIFAYDLNSCEGLLGISWDLMSIFELITIFWIINICLKRYRDPSFDKNMQAQVAFFGIGISSFLILFTVSSFLGQILYIQEISFIGSLGMVIFLGFLTFMIVKYKTFDIKLLGVQALCISLTILIGSQFFYSQSTVGYVIIGTNLIIFSIGSYFLIKSVKKEIRQREEIEVLAQKLEKTNERLIELDQLKSEFISLANHQISSPLTVIKGYISLIQEKNYGDVPKEIDEVLTIIQDSTDKTISAVRSFLDLASIQEGEVKNEFSNFDIALVINEIVNTYRPLFKNEKIKLEYSYSPDDNNIIFADKESIKQAISNILENSIKYTEKGYIKVELKNRSGKKILCITDTGSRNLPEVSTKFIKKFLNSTNDFENIMIGNSLALYIVKKIIESNNGKFQIISNNFDKGTQFVIEI